MNAIERYIKIAERFSWTLASRIRERKHEAKTLDNETIPDEHFIILLDEFSEKDRSLFRIRNELDAATSSAIAEIKTLGMDATPVSKTTLAAWHYNQRFQEEWFNCHSFLRVVLQGGLKPSDPQSNYPGLGELFREMKTKAGSNEGKVTRELVANAYLKSNHIKTIPNEEKPDLEILMTWIKNHGRDYWKR